MVRKTIAYDYAMAVIAQNASIEQVDIALRALNPENCLFSVSTHIESAYTKLVTSILGQEAMDWISWWIYEATGGSKFTYNDKEYNTEDLTLYQFLDIVLYR